MRARPRAWYSNDWILEWDDGSSLLLDCSNWRETAEFELAGEVLRLGKDALLGKQYLLHVDDELIAHADKPSRLFNRFEFEHAGSTYTLRKASTWLRRFELFRTGPAHEEKVGEIRPESMWLRHSRIVLPAELPRAVQVFVFWLAAVVWQRENNSAAAAAGS